MAAGGGDVGVLLVGTNYSSASKATYNGAGRISVLVSPTELLMLIPASDIATQGTAQIVVINGAPGGGASAPATFTIGSSNSGGPGGTTGATPLPDLKLSIKLNFAKTGQDSLRLCRHADPPERPRCCWARD